MTKYIATIGTAVLLGVAIFLTRANLSATSARISRPPQTARPEQVKREVAPAKEARAQEPYHPPAQVKGIYVTSENALTKSKMDKLIELIKETELNAAVININDGLTEDNFPKIAELVKTLDDQKIHTAARIIVFQNEDLAKRRPELALKTRKGNLWRDQGGYYWIDPSDQAGWKEILKISEKAIELGFREINYDYIRFPSDGAVRKAVYPTWDGKEAKSKVIERFAAFLRENLKKDHPDIILSADVFAHTILINNDANIGQKFMEITDYFDVVAPMIYPSHYKTGHFGLADPNSDPYKVVKGTLEAASYKFKKTGKTGVIRPWLQDFKLGGKYDETTVRKEIEAVKDAGFENGWLLWNARNVYTEAALNKE